MRKFFIVSLLLALFFVLPAQSFAAATSERVDGKDRFDVAVNVSKKGWPIDGDADTIIIANYLAFADALSASPLGTKYNAPILLTQPNQLTSATKTEIIRHTPSKVYIIGGTGSVSKQVEDEIRKMGIEVKRIGGQDRFEVSLNIARELDATATAVMASGMVFADALSIAPYAASKGYPILLTQPNKLPDSTKTAIKEKGINKVIVSGGEGSVSRDVYNQLPSGSQRIGGKDRFAVSANIVRQLNLPMDKAFAATGLKFADALTGSVLAAKMGAPMLLTMPDNVPADIKGVIEDKNTGQFVILGGTGSISENAVNILIQKLEGKTIMLDAGHGGSSDPGAVNNTYKITEKSLNMQFVTKLSGKLQNYGANILYTRQPGQDLFISLESRAQMANSQKPDLFISIHHDGSTNTSANGVSSHYSSYRPAIETNDVYLKYIGDSYRYEFVREDTDNQLFYYKDKSGNTKSVNYDSSGAPIAYDPTPSSAAKKSSQLAPVFGEALKTGNIRLWYNKDHNLYVTRWTTMPSVLLELGFMTNNKEIQYLKNESIQHQRAQNLAEAVVQNLQ